MLSIIESLLFASARPLSVAVFERLFRTEKISPSQIKKTLSALAGKYHSHASGMELVSAAGGWQIKTKEENKDYIRRLIKGKLFQLSAPAMEVLSVVAYHQPCRKTDVDTVRGVESGHLLKTLMEKGLIGFGPKSDLPGRSVTYKTTPRFLEVFGLNYLKDLPTKDDINELMPEENSTHQNTLLDSEKHLATADNIKKLQSEQQVITRELQSVSEKIQSVKIKSTMPELND